MRVTSFNCRLRLLSKNSTAWCLLHVLIFKSTRNKLDSIYSCLLRLISVTFSIQIINGIDRNLAAICWEQKTAQHLMSDEK